jgi:hypothetical protein
MPLLPNDLFFFVQDRMLPYDYVLRCSSSSVLTVSSSLTSGARASLECPLAALLLLEVYRPLLVERDPARVEDGGREHSVLDRGEAVFVVVLGLGRAGGDRARGVDELLDGDVAVAALAVEMSRLGRRVLHAVLLVGRKRAALVT